MLIYIFDIIIFLYIYMKYNMIFYFIFERLGRMHENKICIFFFLFFAENWVF